MNQADFLHAECDAITFGKTDIVLYIFDQFFVVLLVKSTAVARIIL